MVELVVRIPVEGPWLLAHYLARNVLMGLEESPIVAASHASSHCMENG